MVNKFNNMYNQIPQVQKLLENEFIKPFINEIGHDIVVDIIRKSIEIERINISKGKTFNIDILINNIVNECKNKKLQKLQRVINATGIILHTNLGRAPLSKQIFENLANYLQGYCNLEYYIPEARRGKRGGFSEELICKLTGAEDALIVNNNAASVYLILNQFGIGYEAIISRGELIQIGGGFRIPDIMNQSGCIMKEIGTTNITTIDDYRNAISDNTKVIFSAHHSNFTIEGFTSTPKIEQLAKLKNENIILVKDLGSGNLIFNDQDNISYNLKYADIVCFSGDKLLGACQAGIIAGKKYLIDKLRKNPLMRILRVDKITYMILQTILLEYVNKRYENIPVLKIINQDRQTVKKRINKLKKMLTGNAKQTINVVETQSYFGGGAINKPIMDYGMEIKSKYSPDKIFQFMLNQNIPVIGYINNNQYTLNFRTIFDADLPVVAEAINNFFKNY